MPSQIPFRSSAIILVKAAPRVGETHGKLVCCAGIDVERGKWVRLYPVAFRTLEDAQKFGRWDIVSYNWSLPKGDHRSESRRLEHRSLEITGTLPTQRRHQFLASHVVTSLAEELTSKRSLALLRPINPIFSYERKKPSELAEERERFLRWHKSETEGLFGFMSKAIVPYEPSPYRFQYRYGTKEGPRLGTCQDWELEATFLKWRRQYGESETLKNMMMRFGEEYPKKGFVLAMGTHKAYPQWLINGVIRLDHGAEDAIQTSLF